MNVQIFQDFTPHSYPGIRGLYGKPVRGIPHSDETRFVWSGNPSWRPYGDTMETPMLRVP